MVSSSVDSERTVIGFILNNPCARIIEKLWLLDVKKQENSGRPGLQLSKVTLYGRGSRCNLCGSRGQRSNQGAKSQGNTTTLRQHKALSAVRTAVKEIPVLGGRLNRMAFDVLSSYQLRGRLYLISNHVFSHSLSL